MKLKVQLVICTDDGREEQGHEVAILEQDCQRLEHLGLTLAEAKQLLATLQQALVAQQAAAFVAAQAQCDDCGATLQSKGQHTRTFRTLFGTVTLPSPRLYHCRCQRRQTTTFRPLTALLTEPTAPELVCMETKWASLIAYGLTAQMLKDFLPVDTTLNATTIQNHTLAVAQRCEDELALQEGTCDKTPFVPHRTGKRCIAASYSAVTSDNASSRYIARLCSAVCPLSNWSLGLIIPCFVRYVMS